MNNSFEIKQIAHIQTAFPTKFGIPRQSGIVEELEGTVIFEPEYRNDAALRGLEGFSHIWLIWQFSKGIRDKWSPTVRPPRLGGNTRMGVFATRSPFRPNPLGLSCVRLERIERDTPNGTVLRVRGADLMDGTPIYDIKPYIPYADSHPEAIGGFAQSNPGHSLNVKIPQNWLDCIPKDQQAAVYGVLAHDPRPSYQHDPERIYGMTFGEIDIQFRVCEQTLTVCGVKSKK